MSSKIRITGKHVLVARDLLGMTQSELATLAGISSITISNFERGLHAPRPSTREAIQNILERRGIVFLNGDKPGAYFDRSRIQSDDAAPGSSQR